MKLTEELKFHFCEDENPKLWKGYGILNDEGKQTTWNGWHNVAITLESLKDMSLEFYGTRNISEIEVTEDNKEWLELANNEDNAEWLGDLICLGWCYTTVIDD